MQPSKPDSGSEQKVSAINRSSPVTRRLSILRKFHALSSSSKVSVSGNSPIEFQRRSSVFSNSGIINRPTSTSSTSDKRPAGRRHVNLNLSILKEKEKTRKSIDYPTIAPTTSSSSSLSMSVPRNQQVSTSFSSADAGNISETFQEQCAVSGIGFMTGGCNMKKLLDDLHQSRVLIEQDQRDYEKARREIDESDKLISKLQMEYNCATEKWKELVQVAATKSTNLSFVDIKNKVVTEDLRKSEKELSEVLEELHITRMKTSSFTSNILSNAVQFSMLYNGTNLGRENRLKYLSYRKQQLESELEDFLYMKNGIAECLHDQDELENKHKTYNSSEGELINQINVMKAKMHDLEREELELTHSFNDQCAKLQIQITEKQKSIANLESKHKEISATLQAQNNVLKSRSKKTDNPGMGVNQMNSSVAENVRSVAAPMQQRQSKGPPSKPSLTFDWKSNSKVNPKKFQASASTNANTKPKIASERTYSSLVPVPKVISAPGLEVTASPAHTQNQGDGECVEFCNDDSYEEDLCLAAAAEVSQRLRSYQPVTPSPSYIPKNYDPPPSKVRIVERQLPITSFMRQLSSTNVMLRPPKPRSSQMKGNQTQISKPNFTQQMPLRPTQNQSHLPSIPQHNPRLSLNLSKTFQFKRKPGRVITDNNTDIDTNVEFKNQTEIENQEGKENIQNPLVHVENHPPAETFSFNDDSVFSMNVNPFRTDPKIIDRSDSASSCVEILDNNSANVGPPGIGSLDDIPFATFNSSRILLTESQEQRLLT